MIKGRRRSGTDLILCIISRNKLRSGPLFCASNEIIIRASIALALCLSYSRGFRRYENTIVLY